MLRIDLKTRGDVTVIRVHGRLEGAGAEELGREFRARKNPIEIDLTNLLTADEVGLSLLRTLRASGAVLRGTSPFVRLLLEPTRDRQEGSR
jgi:hypothetical protein